MFDVIYRTVIIYVVVLLVVRLMGKREIGQLSPFDFVVAIIIAELAAIPMESRDMPLWHGIIPIATVGVLEVLLSVVALFSPALRKVFDGKPQIIIKDGMILKDEMRQARYNIDDLMGQLREKGYPNIADVEVGVLETSGRLSVIPKSQKRPVTPADLGISTAYEGMPSILVMDGAVMKGELRRIDLDEVWLRENLALAGLTPESAFLVSLDTGGGLFINRDNTRGRPSLWDRIKQHLKDPSH